MVVVQKAVIVVPAFNEESVLGHTLDLIRQTNVPVHVIVVNDGSTDKTREIALARGAQVIDLLNKRIGDPVNRGKAAAVFAGFSAALKHSPTAVVTLDADMTLVSEKLLRSMINMAHRATVHRKVLMSVFPYVEEDIRRGTNLSGIRSFSVQALHKLRHSRLLKIPKGYGLEVFLNEFFKGSSVELDLRRRSDLVPHQRTAFRRPSSYGRQTVEIQATRARMKRMQLHKAHKVA